MQKKHQINIITAQPNQDGWRAETTKTFKLGMKSKSYFNTWWQQNIIEWDSLSELSKILEPYILGTHPDSRYSALMYGQFREGTEDIYGTRRLNVNVEDTPHNYLILDIETDSPQYEDTCLDLTKVKSWLSATYPWINEDTGMFLYQTASAGVVQHNKETHKQIRVRAIMETTSVMPLQQSDRKHLLRPYMKATGNKDFSRHIDSTCHEKARLFYMCSPILVETKRLINLDDICHLQMGEPIDFELLRDFEIGLPIEEQIDIGVNPSAPSMNKQIDENKLAKDLKTKPTDYWWDKIQDGNRYEGHYYMLVSAYYQNEIKKWRTKLLQDKYKLGDKTPQSIDSVISYIEKNVVKEFDKPTDKILNHNVIDVDEYRLSHWNDSIAWKDKGVILQKLFEGAGKTESLRQLKQLADEKGLSFLYIAPNTKPVVNTCKELGLTCYLDVGEGVADVSSKGQAIYSFLGICYPSLAHMSGATPGTMKDIKWDIVVLDEIEQLLIFAVDGGGCIMNPEKNNGILRQLIERANLVVGMDARLSNLSLQALETWRVEDNVFDIYTQSKVKPWNQRNFTMIDSSEMALNYIREAVRNGKKVAVVSELDRSGKGLTLETGMKYIEETTGKQGWCVDQNNKNSDIANKYINQLGEWTKDGKWEMGALEKDLKDGIISHIWASPVLQSAWSYISEECPFDLVVGLYPNSVLTAPNIVQHISRFRTSTEFVLFVNQQKRYRPSDIYQRMFLPTGKNEIDLGLDEFNTRHEMHDYWENIQKENRQAHIIEIIESRGGNVFYDYTKITENDKELSAWLKENHDKAWKFLRSQTPFNIYKKFEDTYDL